MSQFNFPAAPQTSFPHTAHVWADIVIWAVALGFLGYALRDRVRTGSWLGVVLMAGGALAYFNEPVDDILGLVHHPRPGQNVVLDTIGPIPMWGLPTYIIFFGALPFVLLRAIQARPFTLRAFWIGLGVTFVLDLLIELPLLQTDLYQYYGDVPMVIARFPLYWLLINSTGPMLCVAVVYAIPGYFTGWRRPLLLLVPVVTDAACSIAVGLPVYTALHTPSISTPVRWVGALISVGIGLVLLDAFARLILWKQAQLAAAAAPEPATARSAPATAGRLVTAGAAD
jgi:hypothetical protein